MQLTEMERALFMLITEPCLNFADFCSSSSNFAVQNNCSGYSDKNATKTHRHLVPRVHGLHAAVAYPCK